MCFPSTIHGFDSRYLLQTIFPLCGDFYFSRQKIAKIFFKMIEFIYAISYNIIRREKVWQNQAKITSDLADW